MIFLNARHQQKHRLCHHLRSSQKALILNDPLLYSPPYMSILCPMGEEGRWQSVCHVRLDAAFLGKPTNKP